MNKKVLDFVNKLEGYKTAIKQLHWDAKNMSQHELCDDIAESIAEFQDTVSEVEQSITGKLKVNSLKPTEYKIKDLKSFVEDVLDVTNSFYKEVKDMGDTYVGMASDCESFLSDMQRKLYLVNFTLKEELKERLRGKINEAMYKRIDNPSKKSRSNVTTLKTRINHIYNAVKEHGLDSRLYHDEVWQAIDFYHKVITDKFGGEVEVNTKPCADLSHADSIESDGGYCDYDPYDHMPRSKQYAIEINFPDGMKVSGYIKCMAAGTVQDPFSRYDTCIVLWPKNNRVLENREMRNESINEYGDKPETREKMGAVAKRGIMKGDVKPYQNAMNSLNKRKSPNEDYKDFQKGFENENRQIKLSEAELKQVVKEAAMKILSETPLNYDVDNFSGRWTKSEPSDEEWALADSRANGDYLDDPFHAPNSWDDDEWIDGDKDMENDYSWSLYHRMNNVGKSPIDRQHDVMDAAQNRRDHAAYWTDKDNERGKNLMNKWINGKRDTDELGDVDFSYDPYKYNESKEPMKVTEAELKNIVKEAAMRVLEKIEIDPKNKGKFTATKKATGKSTEELTHSKNPLTRKRANFAKMAKRGWKPLKESDYMDDGDLESQYRKNPDSMWTYGQSTVDPYTVDGLEPNQIRHAGNGNIKNDNNASWDYFDAVSNGADMKMRNRLDAAYKERTNNSSFNNIRKNLDMDAAFPQTANERFKQDLDKQWKDTQDIDKYSRQANSRPLHRKGSLNRA